MLEGITYEQLDISLAVLEELENQASVIEHQWQLRLERAHYEADRAFRQYDAVEPENRLVARTLELLGREKLQQLAERRSCIRPGTPSTKARDHNNAASTNFGTS